MNTTIFREYDIRGKVGTEFIIEESYDLGRAIAYYFIKKNPAIKTVALGMDGRHSSSPIKEQIAQALCDSGLDVIFIGICPTPVLYFAIFNQSYDAGLMITASHNPKEYNGIKIMLGKKTVWGKSIQEIMQFYQEKKSVKNVKKGMLTTKNVIDDYIGWLNVYFSHLLGISLPIVIDCGNGTAGAVLPKLIESMRWKNMKLLYADIDGDYPNHEADPTIQKNMIDVKNALKEGDALLGIGLDGDADRMAAMTKEGFLVPGDQLLAVFAQEVVKKHPGVAVVFDIKSSQGLIEMLQEWEAKPCICPAGHALIKDSMEKNNALLGGELSCHFFFADRYFGYDDGIYAMMRLIELLVLSGKSLEEHLQIFPKKYSSGEIRFAYSKPHLVVEFLKKYFQDIPDVHLLTIDGVRITWPYGWAIVRASNTQAVLSMRFESATPQGLLQIKKNSIESLAQILDDDMMLQLKEMIEMA